MDFLNAKSSERYGIVDSKNMLPIEAPLVQKSITKNQNKADYMEAVKYYIFLKNRRVLSTGGADNAEEHENFKEADSESCEAVSIAIGNSQTALRRSSRIKVKKYLKNKSIHIEKI